MADNRKEKEEVLGTDWMSQIGDDTYSDAAGVEEQTRFPYAQFHNARDNRREQGGLWIKRRDNLPADTEIDPETFVDKTLVFDGDTGEVEEEGILSAAYHMAIISYPKDANGRPSGYHEAPRPGSDRERGKYVFPVLLAIKEAYSTSTPLRVIFKGPNAVRMMNIIRDHGNFVIAALSRDLRKAKGDAVRPLGRNQVWIPVTHAREQLANPKDPSEKSWGWPVQDLTKESVRESFVPKYNRTGTSVYYKLSADTDEARSERGALVIRPEIARQLAGWAEQYKDAETWAPRRLAQKADDASSFEYGENAKMPHFTSDAGLQANERQMGYALSLCKKAKTDWYTEVMYLISTDKLMDPPAGYEDMSQDALFEAISRSGASALIDHLKGQTEGQTAPQAARKAAAGDALRRLTEAHQSGRAQDQSGRVQDEDDASEVI